MDWYVKASPMVAAHPGKFYVQNTKNRKYTAFEYPSEFVEFLHAQQGQCGFYEYIPSGIERKVYFDVEYESIDGDPHNEPLRELLMLLRQYLQSELPVPVEDPRFAISTSSGVTEKSAYKNSFHVALMGHHVAGSETYGPEVYMRALIRHFLNWCGGGPKEGDESMAHCQMWNGAESIVDMAVYGRNQHMRTVLSWTCHGNRKRRLVPFEESPREVRAHLLTWLDEGSVPLTLTHLDVEGATRARKRVGADGLEEESETNEDDSGIVRDLASKHRRASQKNPREEIPFEYKEPTRGTRVHFFLMRYLLALLPDAHAYDYPRWIRIGMCLKGCGPHFLTLFHEFSRRCVEKYDKKEVDAAWNRLAPSGDVTVESIAKDARDANPKLVDELFSLRPMQFVNLRPFANSSRVLEVTPILTSYTLTEEETMKFLIQFYEMTVAVLVSNHSRVLVTRSHDGEYKEISYHKFHQYFSHDSYLYGPPEDRRRINPVQLWNALVPRIEYSRLVFDPDFGVKDLGRMRDVLNTFHGFAYTVDTDTVEIGSQMECVTDGGRRIWDHVTKIICNDEEAAVEYVLTWMCKVLCSPGTRTDTALFLYGEQGTGKNVFTEIMQKLIGERYSVCAPIQRVLCKFNSLIASRCLVVCNELDESGRGMSHSGANQLKELISGAVLVTEGKGQESRSNRNCCNFIFTSNFQFVLAMEECDRRFVPLAVNNKYSNTYASAEESRAYFNELIAASERDECLNDFLKTLYCRFGDKVLPPIPMTSLKREVLMFCQEEDLCVNWIMSNRGYFARYGPVHLREYSKSNRDGLFICRQAMNMTLFRDMHVTFNQKKFHGALRKIFRRMTIFKTNGVRFYSFGSLVSMEEDLRRHLQNPDFDWSENDMYRQG